MLGAKETADEIEERRLAGAVRPDDGAQFPFLHGKRDAAHRHQAAEAFADVVDFKNAHAALLRAMTPSRPRGKNSTMATKSIPTKDIQLTVMLDR